MRKIVIISGLILLLVIFIGSFAYLQFVRSPEVVNPDELQEKNWKTYSSAQYGFEMKYPTDWKLGVSADNEIPRVVVYKEGDEPRSHHDNATQVIVFPQGLGTEGPFGETRTVEKDLTGASEKLVQEFYLTNNQVRGYYINFNNPPAGWEGYIWGGMKVENMTTEEIPNPSGGYPGIKVSGNVNQDGFNTILKILSTFKFNNSQNETAGWKTYTNEKYGFEIKYPTDWNFREYPDSKDGAGFRPANTDNEIKNEFINLSFRLIAGNDCPIKDFKEYARIAATHEIQNYESLNSIKEIITNENVIAYETTWNVTAFGGKEIVSGPIIYFPPRSKNDCNIAHMSLSNTAYMDKYEAMAKAFKFTK